MLLNNSENYKIPVGTSELFVFQRRDICDVWIKSFTSKKFHSSLIQMIRNNNV